MMRKILRFAESAVLFAARFATCRAANFFSLPLVAASGERQPLLLELRNRSTLQIFYFAFFLAIIVYPPTSLQQNLEGSVVSVSYIPTCEASAAPKIWLDPNFVTDPNKNTLQATNVCDLLGSGKPVLALQMEILPDRIAGGETLEFEVGALPTSGQKLTASQLGNAIYKNSNDTRDASKLPDPICDAQEEGSNCTFLVQKMYITMASSDVGVIYDLSRDAEPANYGIKWSQCDNFVVNTPSGPANTGFYTTKTDSCTNLQNNASVYNYGNEDVIKCLSNVVQNAGALLGGSSTDVCPTAPTGDDWYQFFPQPTTQYSEDKCTVLMCPAGSGPATNGKSNPNANQKLYSLGMMRPLGPKCYMWRIVSPPIPLMNAEMYISLGSPPVPGSSNTATLRLSSLELGMMRVATPPGGDPDSAVAATVVSITNSNSVFGDPITDGIYTCDTCPAGVSVDKCRPGILSDVPHSTDDPVDPTSGLPEDLFLAMASNPWRKYRSRIFEGCPAKVGCTLPTRLCRQCLLEEPEQKGFWGTVKGVELSSASWDGNNCNSNEVTPDIFSRNPSVAAYTCAAGMNGTCIPGYQQTFTGSSGGGSQTICQKQMITAVGLSNADPTSVSYSSVMPLDFNPADPQYSMNGRFLRSDAKYGTGDQTRLNVVQYTGAKFVGETVSVAKGIFVDVGARCNAVQDSADTGIIEYMVKNTGASGVASYSVGVEFILPEGVDPTAYSVENIPSPVHFQVAAGQTVQGPPLQGWSYNGPRPGELRIITTLYSDVVVAYYPRESSWLRPILPAIFWTLATRFLFSTARTLLRSSRQRTTAVTFDSPAIFGDPASTVWV